MELDSFRHQENQAKKPSELAEGDHIQQSLSRFVSCLVRFEMIRGRLAYATRNYAQGCFVSFDE